MISPIIEIFTKTVWLFLLVSIRNIRNRARHNVLMLMNDLHSTFERRFKTVRFVT